MPPDSLPDDVRRLLDERAEARVGARLGARGRIRDRIAALGWEVQDTEGATTARPILVRDGRSRRIRSTSPAAVAASVQVSAEDHPDDLGRFLRGLAAHPPSDDVGAGDRGQRAGRARRDDPRDRSRCRSSPSSSTSDGRLGWADSRTLGLRHSRGEVTILLDTSLEPTGDFVGPAAGGLRRSSGRDRRRLGRHERRRSRVRRGAAGTGGCDRGLLPRDPARGAARGRRLRSPLPLLPQRRPRLLVLRPRRRLDGGADRSAAAASATSIGAGRRFPTPSAIGSASATSTASWTDGGTVPTSCSIPTRTDDAPSRRDLALVARRRAARPSRLAGDHDRAHDLRLARADR